MSLDFCVMYPVILYIPIPSGVRTIPPVPWAMGYLCGRIPGPKGLAESSRGAILPLITDSSNLHLPPNHVKFQVSLRCCQEHPEAFSGMYLGGKRLRQC